MSPPAAAVWLLSYTAGLATPLPTGELAFTTAVTVRVCVPVPVSLNSRWIWPLPLSAGTPPVDTTVTVLPPVRVRVIVLLTACVPAPMTWLATVVALVYVIELAPAVLKLYTEPPEGVAPVIVLPLAFVSLRMPKYTLLCAAMLMPVQLMVAPVPKEPLIPLEESPLVGAIVQLPPPGSE